MSRKYVFATFLLAVVLICPLNAQTTNLKMIFASNYDAAYAQFAPYIQANRSVAALTYALELIRRNSTLLPGYDFVLKYADSDCNAKDSLGSVIAIIEDGFLPDVVVGPFCTFAVQSAALLTSLLNIPTFAWASTVPTVRDKSVYTTLIRPVYATDTFSLAVMQTIQGFSWKNVLVISDTDQYPLSGQSIAEILKAEGLLSDSIVEDDPRRAYRQAKTRSRIIVLAVKIDRIKVWMEAAYDEGMHTGDYVFFMGMTNDNDGSVIEMLLGTEYWDSSAVRGTAHHSLFMLTYASTDSAALEALFDLFVTSFNSSYYNDMPRMVPEYPNCPYSDFLFDSMMLYATIADEILAENVANITDGNVILERARNFLHLDSIRGEIAMDSEADRLGSYWLHDFHQEHNKFNKIATSRGVERNGTVFLVYDFDEDPRWGDGQVGIGNSPPDTPACGFYGEKCESDSSTAIIASSVTVTLVLVLLGAFIFIYFKHEHGIPINWRVEFQEIEPYDAKKSQVQLRRMSLTAETGGHSRKGRHKSYTQAKVFQHGSLALYKGLVVYLKLVNKKSVVVNKAQDTELKKLKALHHDNLNPFLGACVDESHVCVLWQYCAKGSLQEAIENEIISKNESVKFSIMYDIFKGLQYLHNNLGPHGNLKSSNVLINSRWTAQLTDFGLNLFLRGQEEKDLEEMDEIYISLYWTAPEILRSNITSTLVENHTELKPETWKKTEESDIYSAAIVLKELFCKNSPYEEQQDLGYRPFEILQRILEDDTDSFRPTLLRMKALKGAEKKMVGVRNLITSCWEPRPSKRPTAKEALAMCFKINPFKQSKILDRMIKNLEIYTNELESRVEAQTAALRVEIEHADNLLLQMMPAAAVEQLKLGQVIEAEVFASATVFFSSIVDFIEITSERKPEEIVAILNDTHSLMDEVIPHHDVYKVETVGDVYMLTSGLPIRNAGMHISCLADCALDILSSVHCATTDIKVQLGIHTGAVGAGVIGTRVPKYCLFGDTINTTHRVMSSSKAMRIHLSQQSYEALSKFNGYHLAFDAVRHLKGKGMQHLYWLYGREDFEKELPDFKAMLEGEGIEPEILPVTETIEAAPEGTKLEMMPGETEMMMVLEENHELGAEPPASTVVLFAMPEEDAATEI